MTLTIAIAFALAVLTALLIGMMLGLSAQATRNDEAAEESLGAIADPAWRDGTDDGGDV